MTGKTELTVTVVLSLDYEYLKDFLANWDEIADKLCEHAGITSAVITFPETLKNLKLPC